MVTETNKPNVLRVVKRDPTVPPKDDPLDGIRFECPDETRCPHCEATVPLANAKALSTLPCPACGGKVFVPGRVGGFLLYEHIGEGEMGAVFRASDESLNRDVAVKLVRGCHVNDPDSCERLRREACAAGKLNHPRVAQVYALNFSNGHPYLVMELVTGQDFAQRLEQEGRLDERAVLRMALDVAEGLSALHREGLVHGDIKPGNIVLDRDGNAKLVDFGLAGMTRRDSSGALVGTPNYIAPELLRGTADTHRSDLYSLGATLYHLLSGRLPHEGTTATDLLKAKLYRQPVPLGTLARQVSPPTRKLVMRMLEINPEKRQADSDAVAADIRVALALLDAQPAEAAGSSGFLRRVFGRHGKAPQPDTPRPKSRALVTLALGLVAVLEVMVAVKEHSFAQTLAWFRGEVYGRLKAMDLTRPDENASPEAATPDRKGPERALLKTDARNRAPSPHEAASPTPTNIAPTETAALLISRPPAPALPAPVVPVDDIFTREADIVWQSLALGENTSRGSTMQMGGTLIVQGTGTDMWQGHDRGRFVCTKAAGNYAFSAHVVAIADNNPFAVTGLLFKGNDPTLGPGLLFGFLGNSELFLQIREANHMTVIVRRSGRPVRYPVYLKVIRRGTVFEASVSSDGLAWAPFAACELELAPPHSIGFTVSTHDLTTLATAKFANIRLLTPGAAQAAPRAPAANRPTNSSARAR